MQPPCGVLFDALFEKDNARFLLEKRALM